MSDSPITHRSFVSYIDRTREFYAAQGYGKPYRWAHHTAVPFTPLAKPLAESPRLIVVGVAVKLSMIGGGGNTTVTVPVAVTGPPPFVAVRG